MNVDDVLFGVIISGAGLCAAHFRGEYFRWREHGTAERRRESSMRQLQIKSLQEGADSIGNIAPSETLTELGSGAERER